MSYNTRRTGGGRGQTTQVNYHQQPSRPGGNVQQTRNPGYTTTQTANYNTTSQPAYSTQQPGYTTAPPTPTQAPAPPPSQAQQSQTPAPQPPLPTQKPLATSSVKSEPVTPAGTPQAKVETPIMAIPTTPTTENGDTSQPKPFWRKKPFVKLSNKVKRARMNAKLRRVLNPKNALTFLNELRPGGGKFSVREEAGWGFIASVEIDGKTFSGNGLTVSKAKVQASEQALRHILLEQLAKSQQAISAFCESIDESTEKNDPKNEKNEEMVVDTEGDDAVEPNKKRARMELPEDEMPWGSLAAFALHKLFEDWQRGPVPTQEKYDEDIGDDSYFRRPGPPEFSYQRRFPHSPGMFGRGRGIAPFSGRGGGFNGPRSRLPVSPAANFLNNPPRPAVSLGNVSMNSGLLPMKKIPDDANKRHPVMLLNQLKPNLVYNEVREGEIPHIMFKISVEINGQEYVGRGKSKKDAKKMAAKAALAPMGISYND